MLKTIAHHGMLTKGDKILAGVSGGPDSVALVHGLCALAPEWGIEVAIAHLDHGLRPHAAEKEAALVGQLARRLGLTCHMGRIDGPLQGSSLEAQLREKRYAFFEQTATDFGYTKIALGHHADDNAEAVLMRLLRGSGIRGLSGIPPVRDQRFIRPLIAVTRKQILQYLSRHHLSYINDESNADLRFERNRIRHQLIPLLETEYNPNVVATLNRTAALCSEEEAWFNTHLESMLERITAVSGRHLTMEIAPLIRQPLPIQRRLIREALRKWLGHLRRIGADHVERLVQDLLPGRPGRRVNLPSGLLVARTPEALRFTRLSDLRKPEQPTLTAPYYYNIDAGQPMPFVMDIPESGYRFCFSCESPPPLKGLAALSNHTIVLDHARLSEPLTIRNFKPGDRIYPFGMQGSQKIKDLFINLKLTGIQRRQVPLLLSGEEIVWVVGLRRGRQAPVTTDTQKVLRIEAQKVEIADNGCEID